MIRVLINPGHGYPDPGAIGYFDDLEVQEADVALVVGMMVADALKAAGGYDVVVYQDNNLCGEAGPYAYSVVGQANLNRFDYVISIHCNAGGGHGTETLVYNYGGESDKLACCVQHKIVENVGTIDRGVKDRIACQRELAILKKTNMPAILVELAFVDSDDIMLLVSDEVKQKFADSIAVGFTDFIASKQEE